MKIRLRTLNLALSLVGLIVIVEKDDDPEGWMRLRLERGRYPLGVAQKPTTSEVLFELGDALMAKLGFV